LTTFKKFINYLKIKLYILLEMPLKYIYTLKVNNDTHKFKNIYEIINYFKSIDVVVSRDQLQNFFQKKTKTPFNAIENIIRFKV
tara:strand:- start:588 stop:839 length:252 start_codon:yes stop_codon:yes gene_type:complete